ncbi:MAG TPA: arylesterase [Chitinophagaceae bacterium]|nr:arylesterase [Chitinophagaceae bacterium]
MRTNKLHLSIILLSSLILACGQNSKQPEAESTTAVKKDTSIKISSAKTILFFGNSLTAGYGIDPSSAFPAIIQKKLDSLDIPYKTINAGVSGETTSGGLARVDWILRQTPDVFVLELGANDGLRGIPLSETKKNLQAIISRVKEKSPETKIILAGMMIPPNMGPQYTRDFQSIYPDLAKANQVSLIPFILEGVGGEPQLNQGDGIHPTEAGHRIVAENVWKVLQSAL